MITVDNLVLLPGLGITYLAGLATEADAGALMLTRAWARIARL